jgi:hypothetical protein
MSEHFEVVWPRGPKTVSVAELAARLRTLDGAVVGELWDDLFRGDEIFPVLREELRQRFPDIRFVEYPVFGSTHGAEEHHSISQLPGRIAEHGVQAVISGLAC